MELTEIYWNDQLAHIENKICADNFIINLKNTYQLLYKSIMGTGGLLMRSFTNVQTSDIMKMDSMQEFLRKIIKEKIMSDKNIKNSAFNHNFNVDDLSLFILNNLVLSLRTYKDNINDLLYILSKLLY